MRSQIIDRIVERLGTLPAASTAAAGSFVPLGFPAVPLGRGEDRRLPDLDPANQWRFSPIGSRRAIFKRWASPRILQGRPIEATDRTGSQDVAVVNEAFARRFWDVADPLRRTIRVGERELVVVGVAKDGR